MNNKISRISRYQVYELFSDVGNAFGFIVFYCLPALSMSKDDLHRILTWLFSFFIKRDFSRKFFLLIEPKPWSQMSSAVSGFLVLNLKSWMSDPGSWL